MTQEDKELSFIDISGRLHYGVIVNYKENEYDHRKWKITNLHTLSYSKSGTLIDTDWDGWISYEEHQGCGMSSGSRPFRLGEVLPYLRPMASMTEEEKKEMHNLLSPEGTVIYENDGIALPINHYGEFVPYEFMNRIIQYLLENHFDFMNLIPKGLAIEVTEENNPYKE